MYLSLFLALVIRYQAYPTAELWHQHFVPFTITFIFWLVAFYIVNLYNLHLAVNNSKFLSLAGQSFAAGSILAIIFFYISPDSSITPKTTLVVFIIIFFLLFIAWRRSFNSILKSYLPKNVIAFIGESQLALETIQELKQKPHLGFEIAFIMTHKPGETELFGVPILNDPQQLDYFLKTKKVNNIILAELPNSDELRNLFFECLPLKISFIKLADFYENITGRIPIEAISKLWFLENLNEGNKNYFDAFKRVMDLAVAWLIFFISLPFCLIIALIIKIESSGTIFFIQERCGQAGRSFKIIKFRTMRKDNNNYSPTIIDDERITRFGKFLRLTRLDEIPQVLNIIKGEMSFVGPRPERPELIALLEKEVPFYRERMLVKPGLTGADQISGEYHSSSYEDTIKKLQYDLYYIKWRSFLLDLSITFKTIATILSRAGR